MPYSVTIDPGVVTMVQAWQLPKTMRQWVDLFLWGLPMNVHRSNVLPFLAPPA